VTGAILFSALRNCRAAEVRIFRHRITVRSVDAISLLCSLRTSLISATDWSRHDVVTKKSTAIHTSLCRACYRSGKIVSALRVHPCCPLNAKPPHQPVNGPTAAFPVSLFVATEHARLHSPRHRASCTVLGTGSRLLHRRRAKNSSAFHRRACARQPSYSTINTYPLAILRHISPVMAT